MFSPLMVAVAVALASSSTMAQDGCWCDLLDPSWASCSNPSLTSIPDCVPTNITHLDISTPSIPLVADTIRRFMNLKLLTLSDLGKPQISKNFLEGQKNISEFYIYSTSLEYVDSDWFLYARRITTLGLDNNKIASLAADTFRFSPLIVVVVVAFALASFSTMAQGKCECDIKLQFWAKCSNTSLTSIPDCVPSDITALTISTPSIPLVADTISRFTNLIFVIVSDFANPQISKTFLDGQKNISDFDIYFTSLEYVDSDWFLNAMTVTTLGLSNNKIASLAADTFSSLPLLELVYLHNNSLTTLPPTLFEGTALNSLSLDDNPWLCDCDLATFMQWTRDHGVRMVDRATCSNPSQLEGLALVDLTTDLVCK